MVKTDNEEKKKENRKNVTAHYFSKSISFFIHDITRSQGLVFFLSILQVITASLSPFFFVMTANVLTISW